MEGKDWGAASEAASSGKCDESAAYQITKEYKFVRIGKLFAESLGTTAVVPTPGAVDGSGYRGPDPPTAPPIEASP
jgi:hypothetical protein